MAEIICKQKLPLTANFVADLGSGFNGTHMMEGCCPCITKTRAADSSYYSFMCKP